MLNGDPRKALSGVALSTRSRTSDADAAWSATRAAPTRDKGEKLLGVCADGLAAVLKNPRDVG